MDTVSQYLAMGGYAGFVWPAYGIAAAVMIGLLAQSLSALRARENDLSALGEARDKTGPAER
ncbi:MAG TPA: heme exporter protein CcmD [Alphaproteobacteria bacterium]|jgi:heme exporter protein D|nr:heme exporter protein CcmD [Alphaproteobacteria bacterium]